MPPRGPGAVALTLGFTSLRSHPVPSLRWGAKIKLNTRYHGIYFLLLFPHPGAISPMGTISRMMTVVLARRGLFILSLLHEDILCISLIHVYQVLVLQH